MIRGIKKLAFYLVVFVAIKLAATWIIQSSDSLSLILRKDYDPSLIFYTESDEALKAEKEVSNRVSAIQ